MAQTYSSPTGDFVTSTLVGAFTSSSTSGTIGSGLTLPASNGLLQLDYDSTFALGVDSGPETIFYTGYNSGTGALTGITRGVAGTTAVAHVNGATVQCAPSSLYIADLYAGNIATGTSSVGVAAAAIRQEAWTAYTPTYGGSGSQTWGTVTTNSARYLRVGNYLLISVSATGTVGGTPSDGLTFTLPAGLATKAVLGTLGGGCGVIDNGGRKGGHWYNLTTGIIQCDRYDSGNFSAGSGGVNFNAVIELA